MSAVTQQAALTAFAASFHAELLKAVSARCGAPWEGGVAQPEPPPPPEEPMDDGFSATITLAGSLNGNLQLNLNITSAVALASSLISEMSNGLDEAETEALTQLVHSALATLCESAAEEHGVFTATATVKTAPLSESPDALTYSLSDGQGLDLLMQVVVSPELAKSLVTPATPQEAMPEAAPTDEFRNEAAYTDFEPTEPVNLDLVLDVELCVTLRFGQRSLTLREVLELTSGSVIELDRQVEEPVELLLEGKVIARGEAVVIDGNYGLRVTEVPQQLTHTMLR
jgi:flagellar motor switch protein FliN